jgi:hypothetical protein
MFRIATATAMPVLLLLVASACLASASAFIAAH